MTAATQTRAPRARAFFGQPIGTGVSAEAMQKIQADLAERRNRPTSEDRNQAHRLKAIWDRRVYGPQGTSLPEAATAKPAAACCTGCGYLPASGSCPIAPRDGREPRSSADLPMCHTAARAGMLRAADAAEIMEMTCGQCQERERRGDAAGGCLGQAIKLGTENVTAFPECLRERQEVNTEHAEHAEGVVA